MDRLKGGLVLIEALPSIANALSRRVQMTFTGDGPDRALWQRRARRLQASDPRISIEFNGWLDERALEDAFVQSDLLLVPSLWPEPFGRVGPEAGLRSLPVAAFAVGGIPDWLIDGVNGFLASGDPPTAEGLAQAVVKCLESPYMYENLRRGALQIAHQFSVSNHMRQLGQIFEEALRRFGSGGTFQKRTARVAM
jgi:glycosyltransferase involved in cell wall biosynthesis